MRVVAVGRTAPARAGPATPASWRRPSASTRNAPSCPAAAASSRRNVAGGDERHVDGEHARAAGGRGQRGDAGEQAGGRAALAAGPPGRTSPAGWSAPARRPRRPRPRRPRPERVLQQRAAGVLDAGLVDAAHPGGGAAGEDHGGVRRCRAHARSLPHGRVRGRLGPWCASLSSRRPPGSSPAANRSLLARADPRRRPTWSSSPRRSPATSARPGSDVSEYAESLDGPFVTEVRAGGEGARHHRGGRHVRDQRRPGPARSTPWSLRGAATADVPQDPPLRLVRLPRVRPAHAPADRRAAVIDGRRARRSA